MPGPNLQDLQGRSTQVYDVLEAVAGESLKLLEAGVGESEIIQALAPVTSAMRQRLAAASNELRPVERRESPGATAVASPTQRQ